MPHLAPPTLTAAEQKEILRITAANVRDHTNFSMALGTGLRLAEIVGLNVNDVFTPDGMPRVRVRIRKEIAKGCRTANVFLPDRLVPKLKRFWRFKVQRGDGLDAPAPLFCNQSRCRVSSAASGSHGGRGRGRRGSTNCIPSTPFRTRA